MLLRKKSLARRARPLLCWFHGLLCAAALSPPALAVPVEYRISGSLDGDLGAIFDFQALVDVPFQVHIAGDTDGVFRTGMLAGAGRAYINEPAMGSFTVEGLGTIYSASVQVFSIPALARVGFAWNGQFFPLNTDQPAERLFQFGNAAFAQDPSYGRLGDAVDPLPLVLRTELRNPPGLIPLYSTTLNFPDRGSLTLKELSNLSYSVVVVPEPASGVLIALGLAGLAARRPL